jgi:hypothetical protein
VKAHHCCRAVMSGSGTAPIATSISDGGRHRRMFARSCRDIVGWLIPSAILALMPKCPACLAAYLAIGTGFGLSFSAATQLRTSLLILCFASLLYLAVRFLCRFAPVSDTLSRAKRYLAPIQPKEMAP